ncbi:protein phosphatase 1 regulatory subunit 12B isoform X18 [Tursiops truncatus]|uniref:Protein phosphatase 1 regulatory subunit 12B isoform X12 n=1 Tax=Tursiops truncatus TaxID=9739 RepID=A0A6J3QAU2_TURTR|nr:protein phosphatase 1 regulatory subunit 12B isoform X12 [Tursiops truncatus]
MDRGLRAAGALLELGWAPPLPSCRALSPSTSFKRVVWVGRWCWEGGEQRVLKEVTVCCFAVRPVVDVVAPQAPTSQPITTHLLLPHSLPLVPPALGRQVAARRLLPRSTQCRHCCICAPRRPPYKSQADSAAERTVDGVSCGTPLCVITNRPPPSTANGVTAAALLSTPGTDSSVEARERRRSYLTPVRDEEAESLRKARSRQARQTRRSTQGVTLTDLQEAERTFSRSRAERQAQEQPSPKPVGPRGLNGSAQKHEPLAAPAEEAGESRQPWDRSLEDQPVYRRLRIPAQPDKPMTPVSPPAPRPSLYTSSYLLRTGRSSAPDSESSEPPASPAGAKEMDKNEGEEADLGDQSSNRLSIRERRRPKERRRGTGINFWTKDEDETDVSEEVKAAWHERLSRLELGGSDASSERASARARREAREARLATLSSRAGEDSSRDYRKLYESALTENQKLKTKLQEAQLELADVKSKLEKMAQQKQDKTADRSSVLEMEKRERRALERKMSEMEEEMKVLTELKSDNQRLKDENGALIRVISKLSK